MERASMDRSISTNAVSPVPIVWTMPRTFALNRVRVRWLISNVHPATDASKMARVYRELISATLRIVLAMQTPVWRQNVEGECQRDVSTSTRIAFRCAE